jgi:hypothetical protein
MPIMYSCSKITLVGFYTLDKAYDRSQIAEPPDEEYL